MNLKINNGDLLFKDTLVAFFDVIAYSSLIEHDKVEFENKVAQIKRLFGMIKNTSDTDFHSVKLHSWVLSDSLIVVVDTNRHTLHNGAFNVLMATCSSILGEAMSISKLPLRGAIGGGDFYKSNDILVSSALVDAAKLERDQDWLGAAVSDQAVELIKKYGDRFFETIQEKNKDFIAYGNVPMKKDKLESRYYIKPFHPTDPNWIENSLPPYFDKSKPMVSKSKILYDPVGPVHK